jgi:hypothetical protein
MLRHTHRQLSRERSQLNWNAFLESFAIHARNLMDFLTNGGDSRSRKASDFESAYRPPARQEFVGTMNKLNLQILHLGKRRPSDSDENLDVDAADKLYQWVEKAMPRFLASLRPEYRAHWNEELADLSKMGVPQIQVGAMIPTRTTADSEVYAGPFYPATPEFPESGASPALM